MRLRSGFYRVKDTVISQAIYEDLYIAGGNITINAPVSGDLIVAVGTLQLNHTVQNDFLLPVVLFRVVADS